MWIRSHSFEDGEPIPAMNSLCDIAEEGHVSFAANKSPHLEWGDAPEGTRSFAILVIDVDVPTAPDDVNQEGREVPSDLSRTDFSHWVIVDVPSNVTSVAEGEYSDGVTERGKEGLSDGPREGVNDYTGWFADDEDMAGTYKGYDGPCPPWNDSIVHKYGFTVYALDVERLDVDGDFTAADVEQAMEGHVLDRASLWGTYTLNPRIRG